MKTCDAVLEACSKMCSETVLHTFCIEGNKTLVWMCDCYHKPKSSSQVGINFSCLSLPCNYDSTYRVRAIQRVDAVLQVEDSASTRGGNFPLNLSPLLHQMITADDVMVMRRSFFNRLPLSGRLEAKSICSVYPELCSNSTHSSMHDQNRAKDTYADSYIRPPLCGDYYNRYTVGEKSANELPEQLRSAKAHFMQPEALYVGSKVRVEEDERPSAQFLPSSVARDLPFSPSEQGTLLQMLGVPPDSEHARSINDSMRVCFAQPLSNERKRCVSTVEDMMQFASLALGTENFVADYPWKSSGGQWVTSNYTGNFSVVSTEELSCTRASSPVVCHAMPAFPYAIYLCHHIESTRVLKVKLISEEPLQMHDTALIGTVVCHDDTTTFPSGHISFQALGTKPGDALCHWALANTAIFCPADAATYHEDAIFES